MPFLTKEDLYSHLHEQVIDGISREQDAIVQSAVDAAVAEMAAYLGAYDLTAILNPAQPADRNAVVLMYTKDIAVWHFINLANPTVDLELRRQRYDNAIAFFKNVQSGKANPNLPLPAQPEPAQQTQFIKYGGITKRGNNF